MFDPKYNLLKRYRRIIVYFILSCLTAFFEIVLGWLILHLFKIHVVSANSLSTIAGAILHYLLTLKYAFKTSRNRETAFIYLLTFIIGLLLQNGVIWLMYEHVLTFFKEFIRFAASKIISLSISFFAIFFIRNAIYSKYNSKGFNNE